MCGPKLSGWVLYDTWNGGDKHTNRQTNTQKHRHMEIATYR